MQHSETLKEPLVNIHQRLLSVQAAVGRVPKSGWNNFDKYHYVTESDLLDAARLALIENKVALVLVGMEEETGFIERVGKDPKRWAKVKLLYDIVNAEEPGDRIATSSVGYAEDTGDKAIYKAITGATKYLYYKLFMVSTGEDPERVGAPDQKPKAQPAKKPAATTPIQAGMSAAELKTKIRRVAREKGIEAKDVGSVTGVGSFWESDDSNLLSNVLSKLQAS